MTMTAGERPLSVMGRALLLLEPFRTSNALTLTELASHADLPRSSAHRMLAQLVDVGWLHRRGTVYQLGPKMAELGSLALHHDRVHRASIAVMHRLHRETGATVHLTVLDGDELLCLEKIGGRWADRLGTHSGRAQSATSLEWGSFLLEHHAGGTPGPHEHVITTDQGDSAHLLSIAFDAGPGPEHESAALTLTRPGRSAPAGDVLLLQLAAQSVAEQLRGV